jgi:hypothetical protein
MARNQVDVVAAARGYASSIRAISTVMNFSKHARWW